MSWQIKLCPVCDKDVSGDQWIGPCSYPEYAMPAKVISHMSSTHGLSGCPICGRQTHAFSEQARHISTTHTQEEFEAAVALKVLGGVR